jgi:hypothetical protein
MYVDFSYQLIYNFWDRIGDLLDVFFYTGLSDRSIYFKSVIKNIPSEYHKSANHRWLTNICDTELNALHEIRKQIVHYNSLEVKMFYNVVLNSQNTNKLKELFEQKQSFPELFKKHLGLMLTGFERTIRLIDELPNKT